MEIRNQWPPNIALIRQKFDLAGHHPVFTFGSVIYNPYGDELSEDIIIHEQVHERQQAKIGIDIWWNLYLNDHPFRLKQEVKAYQEQYKFIKSKLNREYSRKYLKLFAKKLSSGLYGKIISQQQAEEIIKQQ